MVLQLSTTLQRNEMGKEKKKGGELGKRENKERQGEREGMKQEHNITTRTNSLYNDSDCGFLLGLQGQVFL